MAIVNANDTIVNPDTPLAFLPPSVAKPFENYRYVLVATAGVRNLAVLSSLYC
jgi:hypothetical protein